MKLDEFVKQTLLDITNAVADAQGQAQLFIAPGSVEGRKLETPQMISFEVVVTTSKEAGGGISILSFGDAKAGVSKENSNRISFEVPVYFQAPTKRNERHHTRDKNSASGGGPLGPNIVQDKKDRGLA